MTKKANILIKGKLIKEMFCDYGYGIIWMSQNFRCYYTQLSFTKKKVKNVFIYIFFILYILQIYLTDQNFNLILLKTDFS